MSYYNWRDEIFDVDENMDGDELGELVYNIELYHPEESDPINIFFISRYSKLYGYKMYSNMKTAGLARR